MNTGNKPGVVAWGMEAGGNRGKRHVKLGQGGFGGKGWPRTAVTLMFG